MNFPETPETATEDFREIGPAVVITSSRFWEDLASKIRVKIGDSGWIKRKLFGLSERIGGAVVDREREKRRVPFFLRVLHLDRLLDRLSPASRSGGMLSDQGGRDGRPPYQSRCHTVFPRKGPQPQTRLRSHRGGRGVPGAAGRRSQAGDRGQAAAEDRGEDRRRPGGPRPRAPQTSWATTRTRRRRRRRSRTAGSIPEMRATSIRTATSSSSGAKRRSCARKTGRPSPRISSRRG